jgi:hypothetical protein
MSTLADQLPAEQKRVREMIALYEEIGPAGAFAIAMMKVALERAERAAASGDTVAILRSYEELKGFKE